MSATETETQDTHLPEDTAPEPKVLTIPTARMAEIKRLERERGKTETLAALEQQAKAAGFESWDSMAKAASAAKSAPAPQSPAQPTQADAQAKTDRMADDKIAKDNERLNAEYARATKLLAKGVRANKQLQRDLDAAKAESTLRVAAVQAGVTDPDYAIHMLRRELAGKTQAELATFNEGEYFSKQMKKSHPHLYVATPIPATTSPHPEAPGPATPPARASSTVDTRKMSHAELAAYYTKHGLTVPTPGMRS